ncbi:3-ketoacyl-CoA reductase [Hysterangium stoloniferum]|nr:3-ketoacyl-CoA reductase [Hysterangium stoloniferum]
MTAVEFWDLKTLPLIAAHSYPLLSLLLCLVGTATFGKSVIRILSILLQTFIIPGKSLTQFGAKKGAWAVVTGATDGIGQEFARQLAKAGFNVFLASRSPEKLAVVAAELESFGVKTQIQAIDFSKVEEPAWRSLANALAPLDIGVLVNNVGKSHEMPVDFVDTPDDEIANILQININSTLRVTKIVLPKLIERKRGLILNLGSFSGAVPSPMLATYSGSKAFLSTWTQALAKEVESKGIVVQLLNTYFVVSSMSKIRRASISAPTPKVYVRAALSKIGVPGGALGKPYTSTPYWSHSLVDAVITGLDWPAFFMGYTLRLHKDIRRRALKKREREAAAAKRE